VRVFRHVRLRRLPRLRLPGPLGASHNAARDDDDDGGGDDDDDDGGSDDGGSDDDGIRVL
jgi:hypothetical protein